MGMIEIKTDPTPREVRVFGLLWLVFFAGIGAVCWWKPQGLVGASMILGVAWLVSLIFNPAPKKPQLLGILLPALFGTLGLSVQRGVPLSGVLWATGSIGIVGALLIWGLPSLGKSIYLGWMGAAAPIGWTISHVVLGAVFYLVLFPIGLCMRLVGRDPMQRKLDRDAKSYWIERDRRIEPARYFRQF
jgi:hypothetical protein